MCGLCGVLSNELTALHLSVFSDLMIVSTLRGQDGAGVVAVPKNTANRNYEVLRTAGTAAELITTDEFIKIKTDKKKWSCMLGHARFPTTGTLALEDVHPHVVGNIIGMHNGTMTNVNGHVIGPNDSDSRLLFENINNHGISNTIENSVGAYALVWLNKHTDELCFLRNADRPLFFVQLTDEPGTMFWASEYGMLDLVLRRRLPGRTDKFVYFRGNDDTYMTFRLHNSGKLKPVTYRIIKQKEEKLPPLLTVPPYSDKQTELKVYETKKGSFYDEDEVKAILRTGCAYCGTHVASMDDFLGNKVFFYEPAEYICLECASHDQLARDVLTSHGVFQLPRLHLH